MSLEQGQNLQTVQPSIKDCLIKQQEEIKELQQLNQSLMKEVQDLNRATQEQCTGANSVKEFKYKKEIQMIVQMEQEINQHFIYQKSVNEQSMKQIQEFQLEKKNLQNQMENQQQRLQKLQQLISSENQIN